MGGSCSPPHCAPTSALSIHIQEGEVPAREQMGLPGVSPKVPLQPCCLLSLPLQVKRVREEEGSREGVGSISGTWDQTGQTFTDMWTQTLLPDSGV